MRALSLPGGMTAVLSDTVGFISDLPTDLVAAFRATLEEVREAQLILHVRDISHPETEDQRQDVHAVLDSLGLSEPERQPRIIEVWNKIDRLDATAAAAVGARAERSESAVAVSALTGVGLEALKSAIARKLTLGRETVDLVLAPDQGALMAWLYRRGTVLKRETNADGSVHLRASLSPEDLSRLDERLKVAERS
jgi:GTP-binding protein HflX